MIIKGTSGKDAEIPISLFLTDGTAVTAHVWVTGEVKLRLPGGTIGDATVANIVEVGLGKYVLQLTAGETATTGGIQLILVNGVTWLPHAWEDDVRDMGGVARDALLDYSFRSGRTVRGLFRRLDSFVTNKVTGLLGAAVTFFQPDNITVEFSTTQDVTLGNRGSSAVVTNSETP